MKLSEALETLDAHAQDYGTPRNLREAIGAVTTYFANHPVVDAGDFFAAARKNVSSMSAPHPTRSPQERNE